MFRKLILLSAVSLAFWGCTNNKMEIENSIHKAMSIKNYKKSIDALENLNSKYNKNVKIKLNIGTLYLQSGDLNQAGKYLDEAEHTVTPYFRVFNRETMYILNSNLAEYKYRINDFQEAVTYANKAVKFDNKDPVSSQLTKAKALYFLGNNKNSLQIFTNIFESEKDSFLLEDLKLYLHLLMESKKYEMALNTIDYIEKRDGMESGLGAYQSIAYENLEFYRESVFSMVKELDFQRFAGKKNTKQILEDIQEMEKKTVGQEVLFSAVKAYFMGDYQLANSLFQHLSFKRSLPYLNFLKLAVKMQYLPAIDSDFKEYVSYEPRYSRFPGFYYYLWKGMKNGRNGKYSFETAKNVLEKAVLISPDTIYSHESRDEIQRLLQLPREQVRLYLIPEIFTLYARILKEEKPSLIENIVPLMEYPGNDYSDFALKMFSEFMRKDFFKKYVKSREENYPSEIKSIVDRSL